jgi:hypothetical protein
MTSNERHFLWFLSFLTLAATCIVILCVIIGLAFPDFGHPPVVAYLDDYIDPLVLLVVTLTPLAFVLAVIVTVWGLALSQRMKHPNWAWIFSLLLLRLLLGPLLLFHANWGLFELGILLGEFVCFILSAICLWLYVGKVPSATVPPEPEPT